MNFDYKFNNIYFINILEKEVLELEIMIVKNKYLVVIFNKVLEIKLISLFFYWKLFIFF